MTSGNTLKELRGSRIRCILLTGMERSAAAKALTQLAAPFATVAVSDLWVPEGILKPDEAKLGDVKHAFPNLTDQKRRALTAWWLANPGGANTPNWDIVSTCTIDGTAGIILVEAKAHSAELSHAGKIPVGNVANHERIGDAISGARVELNSIVPGWDIKRDSHYQLSNRFAWGWKLASIGMPVVLVYLGFRNAIEMSPGTMFATHQQWEACVRAHADGIVPASAWGTTLQTSGAQFIPVIASLELGFA